MKQTDHDDHTQITTDLVREYLQENADFFLQHPDLLLMMKFEDQPTGTVSLVERQMKGLRQRNKEMEKELQQVLKNAQDNQHLLGQTISLTLKLIPCNDLTTLAETLFLQLNKLFEIKQHNLLLNQSSFKDPSAFAIDLEPIKEILGDNFPKQQPVCGRLKKEEKKSLFTNYNDVNSVAILPLGNKGKLGLLVLGSSDPTHFDPEMGDLFLLLIADILSRLLDRFNQ